MKTILALALTTAAFLALLGAYWKGVVDARAMMIRNFPAICGDEQ